MKVYKLRSGIVIEHQQQFYTSPETDWDQVINDDMLHDKLRDWLQAGKAQTVNGFSDKEITAPVGSQELWACGVTYLRSKEGRQEESKTSGAADFYAKVYEAERPEIFFKATPHRIAGHRQHVNIRKDSGWNVPEPELTLAVTSSGKIVGYTIGNDMSSRSIEGENPLYLPQAKTYDGCASLGPCIYVTERPLDPDTIIILEIMRGSLKVFNGRVALRQMKRGLEELVSFVYRECSFPAGALIMTGTGIVPAHDFTLQSGDQINITIDPIGTLTNTVR